MKLHVYYHCLHPGLHKFSEHVVIKRFHTLNLYKYFIGWTHMIVFISTNHWNRIQQCCMWDWKRKIFVQGFFPKWSEFNQNSELIVIVYFPLKNMSTALPYVAAEILQSLKCRNTTVKTAVYGSNYSVSKGRE